MSELSVRAENIGAHLVGRELGASVEKFDTGGRQRAVDFLLHWEDGRRGALEVTMVMDVRSAPWQGLAVRDGWRWPAATSWEFRLLGPGLDYQRARAAALAAVAACDEVQVDMPEELPAEVLADEPEIGWLTDVGRLRRATLSPGVVIYPMSTASFVEADKDDFASVLENWLDLPHVRAHVRKLEEAPDVDERHLFLVPVDDCLPARYFTNDFEVPRRSPRGYEGLDGLWVWSNFWHQTLHLGNGSWRWVDFPSQV